MGAEEEERLKEKNKWQEVRRERVTGEEENMDGKEKKDENMRR